MPSHLRFKNQEDDPYDPSDSDEDYTENEKILLEKVRNKKRDYSDSEDEVYGVGASDDDEDDDQEDLALSDVEGQDDDDDLPDIRAWGKNKKSYYSTDYIDPDYDGFQGKDAHLAELEEEEAAKLQKQLAQQLDDDDFAFAIPTKEKLEDKKDVEVRIKADISQLTKREKLKLLEKDAPEFFSLVADFEEKMLIAKNYLKPVLSLHVEEDNANFSNFIETYYKLILNYCDNIYMYMLLKASKVNVQNHPVIKRLYQYRQLILQLEPLFDEVVKPQVELLLEHENESKVETDKPDMKVKQKVKKTLKLLSKQKSNTEEASKKKKSVTFETDKPSKKLKLSEETTDNKIDSNEEISQTQEESDDEELIPENDEQTEADYEVGKRAITYKMSKNKGLTPHRKKEQRNPRVKNRMKFKKAVSRRRGAVREVRKELSRYGGEISGIKATVTKSIKLKS